jgi:hypothetical protein
MWQTIKSWWNGKWELVHESVGSTKDERGYTRQALIQIYYHTFCQKYKVIVVDKSGYETELYNPALMLYEARQRGYI